MRGDGLAAKFSALPVMDQAKLMLALDEAGSVDALIAGNRGSSISFADLAERCAQAKEKAGWTRIHVSELRRIGLMFAKGRGLAVAVQPSDVETFIHSGDWSVNTKLGYRRYLQTIFNFGIKERLVSFNPVAGVELAQRDKSAVTILAVDECGKLMQAALKDRGVCAYLALCLFGGLRPSEAVRVMRDRSIKENHVDVEVRKVRSQRRRLVTLNDALRAWLVAGEVESLVNRRKRLAAVVRESGVKLKQDCLRHSFVSYYCAIHGAKETAEQAGHSESVLFRHYRELVTKQEAERFWALRPLTTT